MSRFFLEILNLSINASYIILAIILVRAVFKKMPRRFVVIMWCLVAIRLLCPFSFESELSLVPSSQTVSPDIMMSDKPSIDSGISIVDKVVNPILSERHETNIASSEPPLQLFLTIASIIWVAGVITLLLYGVISYVHLKKRIADSVLYKDNILFSEKISSPFILGIIKPKIYLPYGLNETTMDYVISHEITHLKRYDYLTKILGFILLAIHWFNPLVWISYILLCRDIELACDENVIKDMNIETKEKYAEALLECSIKKHKFAVSPLAFGEVGVKERVSNIMKYKKPALEIIIVTVIVCVIVAVCLLTNPSENTSSDSATTSGTETSASEDIAENDTTTPDEPTTDEPTTTEEPSEVVEQETLYAYNDELVTNTFGELTLEDYETLKAAFEENGRDFNNYIKIYGTAEPQNTISSYVYYDEENFMDVAELYLYKDNVFGFNYKSDSSYWPHGFYTMDDSTLTLTAEDNIHVYVFNIIDEDTLVFDPSKSSDIPNDSLNAGAELKSGSIGDYFPPEDSTDSQ